MCLGINNKNFFLNLSFNNLKKFAQNFSSNYELTAAKNFLNLKNFFVLTLSLISGFKQTENLNFQDFYFLSRFFKYSLFLYFEKDKYQIY